MTGAGTATSGRVRSPVEVELVEVSEDDVPLLDRLGQLYQYDFSEFDPMTQLDAEGRYSDTAMRDDGERVWWMESFFVMRRFRGRGVGDRAATMLFDRFPGTWEVAQITPNVAAQSFWRIVIGRYTRETYEEFQVADERWHGSVRYFRTNR